MKYEKPQIVVLAPACDAIEAGIKHSPGPLDSFLRPTIGAYEADE